MPGGGLCLSPGPAHLAGLWGLCAKKCQAQVLNFLPFVRLWRDPEFTEKLAAPNNTHIYPLEKFSLSPLIQAAMAFYGNGWRGLGLSSGKFCVYFSLEEAGDREGKGQNLGWETEALGSHPALLLSVSEP